MNLYIELPREHLKTALLAAWLSVWVLIGLFTYLNRYTKRPYFTIWTAAWLFYALWLALHFRASQGLESPMWMMFKYWSIGSCAAFLIWGGGCFLQMRHRQVLFAGFIAFLIVWSYLGAYETEKSLHAEIPLFGLLGLGSMLPAWGFFKLGQRTHFLGAGLLAFGFFTWGLFLFSFPFVLSESTLICSGFVSTAVIQIFIAVSMIILVLEESRAEQERTLRQIQAQREAGFVAANREMEAFAAAVSHDLKAPLRRINGFVQLLCEDLGSKISPESAGYINRIQQSSERMEALVSDLLKLCRAEKQPLHREINALNSIVGEVIAELQSETQGRCIEWKIGELPVIECDDGLFRQVFTNLISNAIKFTRREEVAVIGIDRMTRGDQTVIYVRDNGVGFDVKRSHKLFGIFQRLHSDKEFEGTGIGLATVDRIIRRHGGEIWAEGEPEKGATFFFTVGKENLDEQNGSAEIAAPEHLSRKLSCPVLDILPT